MSFQVFAAEVPATSTVDEVTVYLSGAEVTRIAKGEPIRLAPLDRNGRGTRTLQLERPLDFAAITDHASYLGPVSICSRNASMLSTALRCRSASTSLSAAPSRRYDCAG